MIRFCFNPTLTAVLIYPVVTCPVAGGGPCWTGLPTVLRGLRLWDLPGPPAGPHPNLHPWQGNQLYEDRWEVDAAHRQHPQKGLGGGGELRFSFSTCATASLPETNRAGSPHQTKAEPPQGEGGRGRLCPVKMAFTLFAFLRGLQVLWLVTWQYVNFLLACLLLFLCISCPQVPVCQKMMSLWR